MVEQVEMSFPVDLIEQMYILLWTERRNNCNYYIMDRIIRKMAEKYPELKDLCK